MKLVEHSSSSEVILKKEEAESICGLGKGKECCAFLTIQSGMFQCIRMSYPQNSMIFNKLKENKLNAQYEGGGEGCYWESLLNDFEGIKSKINETKN